MVEDGQIHSWQVTIGRVSKESISNHTTESMLSGRHEQVRNVSSLWTGLVLAQKMLLFSAWYQGSPRWR